MPDLESAIQQEQARRVELEEEISRLEKLLADARRGVVAAEEKAKRELEERLFSDEAIEAAQLAEGAVWESELRNGEITPDKSRRMTLAALRAAYEAATTKPVGPSGLKHCGQINSAEADYKERMKAE